MSILASLTPIAAKAMGYADYKEVVPGTGILPLIKWGKSNNLITSATIAAVVPDLPGLFGGYPQNLQGSERAPAIVMMSLFSVLALANGFVFFKNFSRRHYFFFTLGVLFFNLCKVVGYAARYRWSYDVSQINLGVVSVVMIQVAQLALLVMNQVLAHRIFTWRHPETGASWWINCIFVIIYFFVLCIISIAIIGQTLPYLYFMKEPTLHRCHQVTQAASVLNLLYALLPLGLVSFAFMFKPGQLTAEPWKRTPDGGRELPIPPVRQANWIQSTSIFYYVPKDSREIVYKDQPASKSIRIIPSREPPANGYHELHSEPMHPESPQFKVAVAIVLVSSLVFSLNTAIRCASTFHLQRIGAGAEIFWPHRHYVMYIFYGALEILVLTLYLVTRVDLRFYIPDIAKSSSSNPDAGMPSTEFKAHATLDS